MSARSALLDALAGEVDPFVAERVLDLLDEHRVELVDWLIETGCVTSTRYAMTTWPQSDAWGNKTGSVVAPGPVKDSYTGPRLFEVRR